MSDPKKRPVTTTQIKEILLARGQQAERVRGGLIALLADQTKISNLPELPTGGLVGEMLVLEEATEPLGDVIQSIIAPTPIEEPETHKTARRIMGRNFLGLPEVAKAFGPVSRELQDALATIPFDEATLRSCRETHVLGADIGLSIIDVRGRMQRGLFCSNEDAWYNTQEFARRTEGVAWRLIRKTSVADSTSKNWAEQSALIGKDEEVPTARRMVYAIMLAFATTGERLFERIYVLTIDTDSNGYHVHVGYFDERGLYIHYCDDHEQHEDLGISSSQKSRPSTP